jgi:hypothetical protein
MLTNCNGQILSGLDDNLAKRVAVDDLLTGSPDTFR